MRLKMSSLRQTDNKNCNRFEHTDFHSHGQKKVSALCMVFFSVRGGRKIASHLLTWVVCSLLGAIGIHGETV